jgi:outer membrane protein OmpA-like peptidoglycan-associated protein
MDRNWRDKNGNIHPTRRYVFHEWEDANAARRHNINPSRAVLSELEHSGALSLDRLRRSLAERIHNIENFSLPIPDSSKCPGLRRLFSQMARKKAFFLSKSTVFFNLDQDTLTEKATAVLVKAVLELAKQSDIEISIQGHACDLGSETHNSDLALRRAERVRGYLQTALAGTGVTARWKLASYGSSRPIAPNDSEQNRAKNRRAVLEVAGTGCLEGFEQYVRTNPDGGIWVDRDGQIEVKWNALIIDLLEQANCRGLYGNHDGYRGDRNLNTKISTRHRCKSGFISEPGIWFEHGHRFDPYNRDGSAFGAAVTNYVYYHWNVISVADVIKAPVVPQRQKSFMTGAALWYALANYPTEFARVCGLTADAVKEQLSGIYPFAVYVLGHTHTGDLARVSFRHPELNGFKAKAGIGRVY